MVTIAVGPSSFNGKTMIETDPGDTPLQEKLNILAENIAKLGAAVALLMLVVLLLKYVIETAAKGDGWGSANDILKAITDVVIQAITIIVVAVGVFDTPLSSFNPFTLYTSITNRYQKGCPWL